MEGGGAPAAPANREPKGTKAGILRGRVALLPSFLSTNGYRETGVSKLPGIEATASPLLVTPSKIRDDLEEKRNRLMAVLSRCHLLSLSHYPSPHDVTLESLFQRIISATVYTTNISIKRTTLRNTVRFLLRN